MRRAILRHACLLLTLFFVMAPAEGKRVALVVGIDSYSNLPEERQLKKAVNDARSIRDTLKADLGFNDVFYEENADRIKVKNLIRQAEAHIERGDVVFIYFSGHGVSIGSGNYLLPSDVPKPVQGDEEHLIGSSFEAEALAQRMLKRGAQAVFSVLDACRDNPFVDERGRAVGAIDGLTTIDKAEGVFTLFAAGLGQIALDRLSNDDPNPNSVFTRSLIPLLKKGGLTQVVLAKEVQKQVADLAATIGHKQRPAYEDGILGFVTLKESEARPMEQPKVTSAFEEWQVVEKSRSKEVLEAFRQKYRDDPIYSGLAAEKLAALFPEKGEKGEGDNAASAIPLPLSFQEDASLNDNIGQEPTVITFDQKGNMTSEDGGGDGTAPQTEIASVDPDVDVLVRQCDMLTSHPDDSDKPDAIPGIVFDKIISNEAVQICEKAMSEKPDLRRLVYQTGRAYDRAENYETAGSYYRRAAAMGSKAAMAVLVFLHGEGHGVEKSTKELVDWAKNALRKPDSFRQRSVLASYIGDFYGEGGTSLTPDQMLARAWYAVALDEGKFGASNLAALIDKGEGGPASSDSAAIALLLGYCRGDVATRYLLLNEGLSGWKKDVGVLLQEALTLDGFYSGKVDGVVGEGTRKALEQAESTMCPKIEESIKAEGGWFAALRKKGMVGDDPRKELQ